MTKNESDKVEVQRCEGSSKQGWKSKSQIRHKIIYSYCVLLFNIFNRRQVFQKMSLKVQRTFSRIESRGLCVGSAQNEITDFAKKTDNFCRNIDYNFRILRPQFLKVSKNWPIFHFYPKACADPNYAKKWAKIKVK